jgi:hypothetical protein
MSCAQAHHQAGAQTKVQSPAYEGRRRRHAHPQSDAVEGLAHSHEVVVGADLGAVARVVDDGVRRADDVVRGVPWQHLGVVCEKARVGAIVLQAKGP